MPLTDPSSLPTTFNLINTFLVHKISNYILGVANVKFHHVTNDKGKWLER